MLSKNVDLVVIGAGAAGLAAAIKARELGIKDIVVLERDNQLGGILPQCIHTGFGIHYFKQELSGPEFIQRFIDKAKDTGLEMKTNTMVIEITPDKKVIAVNPDDGIITYHAKAIILAMGCRERTRGAIALPGTRPAGIYTAGTAQRLVNIEGYLPGKEIVILGSGDVGLIMARRFTLEGAKVKAVVEILPYPGGLMRNVVQCLEDFNIPLYLSHTVVDIVGNYRVEGVKIAKVDENWNPIPGTEKFIKCDTLILSVGLIPENELSREAGITLDDKTGGPIVNEWMETDIPGIFACGNVLVVYDLVDYVVENAEVAAEGAVRYIKNGLTGEKWIPVEHNKNVRFVVPHKISGKKDVTFFLRVTKPFDKVKLEIPEIEFKRTFIKVKPSEMIRLPIKKEKLAKATGKITINVIEVP
ncbi:MAG: FAD-dependent oxidoreductase [Candidatus Asgardarchaeia archaeon]